MEPRLLGPSDWAQVARVLVDLYLLVAFAVVGAVAWLLDRAILPSLVDSFDLPEVALRWRRVLLPIWLVALGMTLVTLARALLLAGGVLQQLYPRFLI